MPLFLSLVLMKTIHCSEFRTTHFPSAAFLAKTHTLVPLVISNFSERKDNNILFSIVFPLCIF